MFSKFSAVAAFALARTASAETWAVVVAGSNTYGNYRHQADACHAYQILTAGSIPPERIILMAYDDIASSPENPFPGQVFNKPTRKGEPGVDVYAGCDIAYSGDDVTKENFFAVLKGDASAVPEGKPVLQSTKDDDVFVYFADHGGVGLIAMPVGDYVYYDELNQTLTSMSDSAMYSRLVFYLEACESGSMFEDVLSPELGIYAQTAANAEESSYGTYCGVEAVVDGVNVGSCLGDLYSVSWMEDSDDLGEVCSETLLAQLVRVTKETDQSHVMSYGDQSYMRDTLCAYQAKDCDDSCAGVEPPHRGGIRGSKPAKDEAAIRRAGSVDSRDVQLEYLMTKAVLHGGSMEAVAEEVRARDAIDAAYDAIVTTLAGDVAALAETGRARDAVCLRDAVHAVEAHCGRHSDYGLKHVKTLNHLCNAGFSGAQIDAAAATACSA